MDKKPEIKALHIFRKLFLLVDLLCDTNEQPIEK